MLVYATTADYQAWTGTTAPANITGLLRAASMAVREATELAFYTVDATGMPTDTVQKQAFNDATCCQAAALAAFGVDPNAGGTLEAGAVETSVGIGTARETFADATAAVQAQQALIGGLTPDAKRILRNARLMLTSPWVVG